MNAIELQYVLLDRFGLRIERETADYVLDRLGEPTAIKPAGGAGDHADPSMTEPEIEMIGGDSRTGVPLHRRILVLDLRRAIESTAIRVDSTQQLQSSIPA